MSKSGLQKKFWELCNHLNAVQAILYTTDTTVPETDRNYHFTEGFAYTGNEDALPSYHYGEGLIGQVAKNKAPITIEDIPDGYLKIVSGLGSARPAHILIFPVLKNNEVNIIFEFAFFDKPDEKKLELLKAVDVELFTTLQPS